MRVFLDTNVLFSALHSRLGRPNDVVELAVRGGIQVVVSSDVLTELARNVAEKAPKLIPDLAALLRNLTLEVVAPLIAEIDRWEAEGFGTDSPIVAAAIDAEVDYFCTGDKRLLRRIRDLAPNLRAVSPAELLRLLE